MALSRRSFLSLGLTAVLALGAAGCGSSQEASPQGSTRTVVDIEGTEVKVPEKPERVVTLSEPTLDATLALGVKPVGTISGRGQSTVPPYLLDQAGDIDLVGTVGAPNYEAIGALKPDLILVDGTSVNNNPPVVEALRKIAPVVFTGYAGGDWRKNLKFVADALNQQQGAEKIVAEYNDRVTSMKTKLAQRYPNATYSVVRWQGSSAALILRELPAGRVLKDLDMRRPPAQDRVGGGHSEPVSREHFQDIDADYMFFGTLGGSSVSNPNAGGKADSNAAQEAVEAAAQTPGFKELKAYRENHVIPVDGAAWTSTGGPQLIRTILDDINTHLLQ